MRIDASRAAGMRRCGRQELYFCSDICIERFDAEPERYSGDAGGDGSALPAW
jgi:YHS domain-containing protein